jgi:hypothetical protein
MSDHQILCINKADRNNPWERITHIGGLNPNGTRWRLTQEEAIEGINSGKWRFWVASKPKSVWVEVAVSRFDNEYLTTEADGESQNNLLSQDECP